MTTSNKDRATKFNWWRQKMQKMKLNFLTEYILLGMLTITMNKNIVLHSVHYTYVDVHLQIDVNYTVGQQCISIGNKFHQ